KNRRTLSTGKSFFLYFFIRTPFESWSEFLASLAVRFYPFVLLASCCILFYNLPVQTLTYQPLAYKIYERTPMSLARTKPRIDPMKRELITKLAQKLEKLVHK